MFAKVRSKFYLILYNPSKNFPKGQFFAKARCLTISVLNLIAQFFHQNVPTGGSTCRWQNQQWSKCSVTCGVGFQTRKKYLETPVPPNVDPRDIDFEECGNKTFEDTRPCFGPKCTGSTINY